MPAGDVTSPAETFLSILSDFFSAAAAVAMNKSPEGIRSGLFI